MSSSHIECNGTTYPVRFIYPRDSWLWKKDEWMAYTPSNALYTLANEVTETIQKAEQLYGKKHTQKEREVFYADEIEASWLIEFEILEYPVVQKYLRTYQGVQDLEDSLHSHQDIYEEERAAVVGSLYLLSASQNEITEEDICKAHELFGTGISDTEKRALYGKLRPCEELVGRLDRQTKEYLAFYEAPGPESVPQLLSMYTNWLKTTAKNLPPVLASALAHLYFVIIHPFHDGNGRMARLIADTFLNHENTQTPILFISPQIFDDHGRYYKNLAHASSGKDLEPFISMILTFYRKAARNILYPE